MSAFRHIPPRGLKTGRKSGLGTSTHPNGTTGLSLVSYLGRTLTPSPVLPPTHYDKQPCYADVQGRVLTARRETSGRGGGGRRGKVKGFSKRSRGRAIRKLGVTDERYADAFLTLLLPPVFDLDPSTWKRHLRNFFRQLLRDWPGVSAFWVMEMETRKSGEMKGTYPGHFHILMYNLKRERIPAFKLWVSACWFNVCGSEDINHFKAGTNVSAVRNVEAVARYITKYITKANHDRLQEVYPGGAGRFWGVHNAEKMPVCPVQRYVLTESAYHDLLRLLRRRRRAAGRRTKFSNWSGDSWVCPNPDVYISALGRMGHVFFDLGTFDGRDPP